MGKMKEMCIQLMNNEDNTTKQSMYDYYMNDIMSSAKSIDNSLNGLKSTLNEMVEIDNKNNII